MRRRLVDKSVPVLLTVAGIVFVLAIQVKRRPMLAYNEQIPLTPDASPNRAPLDRDGDALRFLLAILTGVALGAGAAVLPALLSKPDLTVEFAMRVLLWLASLAVVLLIYLSAADASRMYRGRQDVGQTATFLLITMLEAALFSATTFDSVALIRTWFVLFAAFAAVAAAQVAFVYRRVRREPAWNLTSGTQVAYLRSLKLDGAMAVLGAITALTFSVIVPPGSQLAGIIAAILVLAYMTVANLSQRRVRRTRPA